MEEERSFIDYDEVMDYYWRESIQEFNWWRPYKWDMYYALCEDSQQILMDILNLTEWLIPEVAYIPRWQTDKKWHKIISKDWRYWLLTFDEDFKIQAIMNNKWGYTFISKRGKEYWWDTDWNFTIYVKKDI